MTKPLADIRLEIDEIDQQLVRLIASRGALVK
ncbi:chorismate mutase [Pseudolactococcus piscium]|nr:chorismate mutase [Lactococcus piscium]